MAIALLFSAVGGIAEQQPQVIQPDSGGYSTVQRSTLLRATAELERILADRTLGARRALGERGWTSLQFATFTAGSLEIRGYDVLIASALRSDAQSTWVLVGVDTGGVTAWIPVEATPAPGVIQEGLGRIPWDGPSRYDARYTQFEQTVLLGPNQAPVAVLRPASPAAVYTGDVATFLALLSRDPDGEIVLYIWGVDDTDAVSTMKTTSFDHIFATDVPHKVTLTVVDSRGARATADLTVQVYGLGSDGVRTSSGCGCGK